MFLVNFFVFLLLDSNTNMHAVRAWGDIHLNAYVYGSKDSATAAFT